MTDKIFLVGSIVTLAAQETDTDLLDMVYKLLVTNTPEEVGA